MKKLFTVFLVAMCTHVFACDVPIDLRKWSISVIGLGNYGTAQKAWQPYFLPGIQFNREAGNYEMRFAVERTKYYAEPTDQSGEDILYISGPERRTLLRIGLEREWKLNRWINPYAAIDIAGQKVYSELTYVGGIAGMNEKHAITTNGVGLLPAIGFKSEIANHVAFFAEYRAEAFVNNVNQKSTYYNGNVDSRPSRDTQVDFNVGSIGNIGFQFQF